MTSQWTLAATLVRGAILLLLAGVLSACETAPDAEPEATAVEEIARELELGVEGQAGAGLATDIVRARPIERVIETTGFVGPDQRRLAHIRPLARGVVEQVAVQLGDHVTAGQVLMSYDNIELGDVIGEYLELRAGITRLEARSNVAEKYLRRAEDLIQVEAISRAEYELRQAEHEQAIADLRSQDAGLNRVEEKLHRFGLEDAEIDALASGDHGGHRTASHSVLRAPFAGIVIRYDVSMGEVIDREDEPFTIVDTSQVWVLADLYEKDLGAVVAGGTADISVPSYPGQRFQGAIEYVADFLDPASRTAKVRCVVANADGRLKLEMYATVRIPVMLLESATAVPVAAIQEIDGETVVFVQESAERFVVRTVVLGVRGDDWIEVIEGVRPGETVVTAGSFYLKSTALRASIGDDE